MLETKRVIIAIMEEVVVLPKCREIFIAATGLPRVVTLTY